MNTRLVPTPYPLDNLYWDVFSVEEPEETKVSTTGFLMDSFLRDFSSLPFCDLIKTEVKIKKDCKDKWGFQSHYHFNFLFFFKHSCTFEWILFHLFLLLFFISSLPLSGTSTISFNLSFPPTRWSLKVTSSPVTVFKSLQWFARTKRKRD